MDMGAQELPEGGGQPTPSVTFAVYDEGEGVRSLYLQPVSPLQLALAILPLIEDRALVAFTDRRAPAGARPLRGGGWLGEGCDLLTLRPPFEATLVGGAISPQAVEDSLLFSPLAHPQEALPPALDALCAVAMGDARHAVLLSRSGDALRAALRGLLVDLLALTEDDSQRALPEIPESTLDELLAPLPEETWRRACVRERRSYRVLDLHTLPAPQPARGGWGGLVKDRRGGRWRPLSLIPGGGR